MSGAGAAGAGGSPGLAFGIDVPSALVWTGYVRCVPAVANVHPNGARKPSASRSVRSFAACSWSPGGDYARKLVVKNVSKDIQKLTYQFPSTKYFCTAGVSPCFNSSRFALQT
jgi:hypothetical protein